MNFSLLLSLASAAPHGGHGGHGHYSFDFKKEKPSNKCEQFPGSLESECPENYELIEGEAKGKEFSYCENITYEDVVYTCPYGAIEIEGECYSDSKEKVCPDGYSLGKDKKTCFKSKFEPVCEMCPPDFEIVQGKKGPYCEFVDEKCDEVCPEGSEEVDGECLVQVRLYPNECPPDYELSPDGEHCVRTFEAPCDKKDLMKYGEEDKKSHGGHHHLRRLQHHEGGHHGGDKSKDKDGHGGHDDKYVKVKPKAPKEHDKKEKVYHDVKHVVVKPDKKGEEKKKEESKKVKPYAFSYLVEAECIYEEVIAATPVYDYEGVERVKVCKDIVETAPIEYECSKGYEFVTRKYDEPICVKTKTADLECLEGTEKKGKCYLPTDKVPTCPVPGGIIVGEECEYKDVQPPKYTWLLVRQCEGYECQKYYEHSCIFK